MLPTSPPSDATPQRPSYAPVHTVSLSQILSALSYALDLTEDAVPGHAIRCCLLGMRIAVQLGIPTADQASLYYALLLKDIGCSSNAARLCQIIGGDERSLKSAVKLEDWTRPNRPTLSGVTMLWRTVLPNAPPHQKLARVVRIALHQHENNQEVVALRCDRGADIARKLGLGELTAQAIRTLDEHWDGYGYPDHLEQQAIPILARILAVAQHLDVFSTERDPETAMRVLAERSGRWFDPQIVKAAQALDRQGTLWRGCLSSRPLMGVDPRTQIMQDHAALEAVRALDPDPGRQLAASEIDNICAAFADVVDAKSPFTFRHSIGVAEVADSMARTMGLQPDRQLLVHRAALLHDIGKLRVPNSILDKGGPLTAEERELMEEHPGLTRQILGRVAAFDELSRVAGAHHERLDGSGYPKGLTREALPLEARLIAVADVYRALTEERPYREPLALDEVITLMQHDVPRRLDARCFEALVSNLADAAIPPTHPHPHRTPTWGSLLPNPTRNFFYDAEPESATPIR